jgi:hypothetical protein
MDIKYFFHTTINFYFMPINIKEVNSFQLLIISKIYALTSRSNVQVY